MRDTLCYDFNVWKNKSIEIQLSLWMKQIALGANIDCYWDCDHPGGHIEIRLLFLYFQLSFYDHRHVEDFNE